MGETFASQLAQSFEGRGAEEGIHSQFVNQFKQTSTISGGLERAPVTLSGEKRKTQSLELRNSDTLFLDGAKALCQSLKTGILLIVVN